MLALLSTVIVANRPPMSSTTRARRVPRQGALLDFSVPHVLRTVRAYDAAVREVARLLDLSPKKRTVEYDRLEFLSVLIEAYEDAHEPEPRDVTPQEAVTFMLDQKGMTRAELADIMGGRSRVSDFFNGKRGLSTGQVKALRNLLGIPADLLLG
jgi:HTH-type transcriptional regulator/antitoxin HigA